MLQSHAWLGGEDGFSVWELCVCFEYWTHCLSCLTIIVLTSVGVGFTVKHRS